MELQGVIKKFTDVESGVAKSSGKEWKKQSFVISNYEGFEGREVEFCFEVFGAENVEKLTQYNKVGDEVKVQFNIDCNEWNNRYYTSLKSWRVEKVDGSSVDATSAIAQNEEPDNLPF